MDSVKPKNHRKILVVTPRFPFAKRGACEDDRSYGVKRLVELGFEVEVIAKCLPRDLTLVEDAAKFSGAKIYPVLYSTKKRWLKRFTNPLYLDGAAFEYTEPEIKRLMRERLDHFKPDLVWFDYTYLWPLYREVRKRKIPIITRSINYEAVHFLEEDGRNFKNYLKFLPKVLSEELVLLRSDAFFSITPKEARLYRQLGGRGVKNLPLRGLPRLLGLTHKVKDSRPLHVFFMGSTYNVAHNQNALLFIIRDIAPLAEKLYPGEFVFHIIGSKVPDKYKKYFNTKVIYDGPKYEEELEKFMDEMDVALIPSLMGAGMQQKIFEPLCRKIPLLTSLRGIADYPFKEGEHFLAGVDAQDFVDKLTQLRDKSLRIKLSEAAHKVAVEEFSQQKIDEVITSSLSSLL